MVFIAKPPEATRFTGRDLHQFVGKRLGLCEYNHEHWGQTKEMWLIWHPPFIIRHQCRYHSLAWLWRRRWRIIIFPVKLDAVEGLRYPWNDVDAMPILMLRENVRRARETSGAEIKGVRNRLVT